MEGVLAWDQVGKFSLIFFEEFESNNCRVREKTVIQISGKLDLIVTSLTLQMSVFDGRSGNYTLCAVVAKDERRAMACVDIEVVEKTPPLVNIL